MFKLFDSIHSITYGRCHALCSVVTMQSNAKIQTFFGTYIDRHIVSVEPEFIGALNPNVILMDERQPTVFSPALNTQHTICQIHFPFVGISYMLCADDSHTVVSQAHVDTLARGNSTATARDIPNCANILPTHTFVSISTEIYHFVSLLDIYFYLVDTDRVRAGKQAAHEQQL